ncbi:dihydropteroate synthase [Porphyromonas gingivalis F0568]|nr:dihydropteroate synthase [Porphyromonas gingivalis F0568]
MGVNILRPRYGSNWLFLGVSKESIKQMKRKTLNLGGRLFSLEKPVVMGIMNITPDSFYSGSRLSSVDSVRSRAREIVEEGGALIDVGAYSSRPNADHISAQEEMERLRPALKVLRDEFSDMPVSVDTFRADVAKMCVEEYGAAIVNDISGGQLDGDMFRTVAALQVPYILMHMRGTPATMQSLTDYEDIAVDILDYFVERVGELRGLGLHDIILDPGYGFSKTLEQNYELLSRQEEAFGELELPILVGISRKSMIYKLFGTTPEEALNGTTALNMYSVMHGADILRVHDVREAVEVCRIADKLGVVK